jgi:hypothetical protein
VSVPAGLEVEQVAVAGRGHASRLSPPSRLGREPPRGILRTRATRNRRASFRLNRTDEGDHPCRTTCRRPMSSGARS